MPNYLKSKGWAVPCLLLVSTLCAGQAPLPEPVTDQETELGQAVYNQLKEKGEIVESSPLYDTLRPIAEAISKEAQPRYNHPFKFFVVHETQPNAFATPGGNVYVVDSLFYFVKNTEQLAGTLCHEVSHTIHRDAVHRLKEQQRIERRELGAALLLGPSLAQMIAIQMLGDLHSLAYSRDVESRADVTGSDVCAATGYNPMGAGMAVRRISERRHQTNPSALVGPSGKRGSDQDAAAALSRPSVGFRQIRLEAGIRDPAGRAEERRRAILEAVRRLASSIAKLSAL
jgi:Zn-dependent protease with chaperone function